MAIDIYEGKTLRVSIPLRAFERLESAQSELVKRTGRPVDPYGTTSLEPEHTLLWLAGLRQIRPQLVRGSPEYDVTEKLIAVLEDVTARKRTITIEGD